jgi:hypothetical protein
MAESITPPPELVQQWADMIATCTDTEVFSAATQWGADQELEACCEWLSGCGCESYGRELRAARRPKPPSLKEQALEALSRFDWNSHATASEMDADFKTVLRALEALPDD